MNNDDFVDIQNHLLENKGKLRKAINDSNDTDQLIELLRQVDSALERINKGTYGKCLVCHDSIEKERLLADPLVCFCLDHLDKRQQKLLEQDLELASQIQNYLLPQNNISYNGYDISYTYLPAGPVSGDYCDVVLPKNRERNFYFILGDITGKGIAASMLVSHIYSIFHSLMGLKLPLGELANKANGLFCDSSPYGHFATAVCGKADDDGNIEICNAGHCLPVLIHNNNIKEIESTGLPFGLFHSFNYKIKNLYLEKGDTLLLYSDGLSEARRQEEEFGTERITKLVKLSALLSPSEMINFILENLNSFLDGTQKQDDLTIMAIKRV